MANPPRVTDTPLKLTLAVLFGLGIALVGRALAALWTGKRRESVVTLERWER